MLIMNPLFSILIKTFFQMLKTCLNHCHCSWTITIITKNPIIRRKSSMDHWNCPKTLLGRKGFIKLLSIPDFFIEKKIVCDCKLSKHFIRKEVIFHKGNAYNFFDLKLPQVEKCSIFKRTPQTFLSASLQLKNYSLF